MENSKDCDARKKTVQKVLLASSIILTATVVGIIAYRKMGVDTVLSNLKVCQTTHPPKPLMTNSEPTISSTLVSEYIPETITKTIIQHGHKRKLHQGQRPSIEHLRKVAESGIDISQLAKDETWVTEYSRTLHKCA